MILLNKIADAMIEQNPDWSSSDEDEIFGYVDKHITMLDQDLKDQIACMIVDQLKEWESSMYEKDETYYYIITH